MCCMPLVTCMLHAHHTGHTTRCRVRTKPCLWLFLLACMLCTFQMLNAPNVSSPLVWHGLLGAMTSLATRLNTLLLFFSVNPPPNGVRCRVPCLIGFKSCSSNSAPPECIVPMTSVSVSPLFMLFCRQIWVTVSENVFVTVPAVKNLMSTAILLFCFTYSLISWDIGLHCDRQQHNILFGIKFLKPHAALSATLHRICLNPARQTLHKQCSCSRS